VTLVAAALLVAPAVGDVNAQPTPVKASDVAAIDAYLTTAARPRHPRDGARDRPGRSDRPCMVSPRRAA